jgi:hypothetical protein
MSWNKQTSVPIHNFEHLRNMDGTRGAGVLYKASDDLFLIQIRKLYAKICVTKMRFGANIIRIEKKSCEFKNITVL